MASEGELLSNLLEQARATARTMNQRLSEHRRCVEETAKAETHFKVAFAKAILTAEGTEKVRIATADEATANQLYAYKLAKGLEASALEAVRSAREEVGLFRSLISATKEGVAVDWVMAGDEFGGGDGAGSSSDSTATVAASDTNGSSPEPQQDEAAGEAPPSASSPAAESEVDWDAVYAFAEAQNVPKPVVWNKAQEAARRVGALAEGQRFAKGEAQVRTLPFEVAQATLDALKEWKSKNAASEQASMGVDA